MIILYHVIIDISRRYQLVTKKQVIFRLDEEVYQQLQIYAINNKTSVQKIMEEYVYKILQRKDSDDSRLHPHGDEARGFQLRFGKKKAGLWKHKE